MDPINFRKANQFDSEFLRSCINDLENEAFEKKEFESRWMSMLQNTQQIYLVVQVKSLPVGFIGLRIETQLHHQDKVAEILELYVIPEYRNQNIGSILIGEASSQAKLLGCSIIEVATNKQRFDAIRFYEREGFVPTHYKSVKNLL